MNQVVLHQQHDVSDIERMARAFARFDLNVMPEPNSGCWLWIGRLNAGGYGVFDISHGKMVRAHRFSWERANGPIPAGMDACHRCDVRSCCNPDHIFIGSRRDNMIDAARKGRTAQGERHRKTMRRVAARGSRNGQAKLTEDDVVAIRARLSQEDTQREIAESFGVTQSIISDIKLNKKWAHVAGGAQ